MCYIRDRFYTYLISALHRNSDPETMFFFDRDDNSLFVLAFNNGQYKIHDSIPQFKSDEINKVLNEKIIKVAAGSKRILALRNLPNAVKIDYDTPNRTMETYHNFIILVKEQFDLTQLFIEQNQIDAEGAFVIE